MLRFSISETDAAPPKQILEASGDAGITQARSLRRVIKKDNHHYLLAILMLTRASAAETLPLFLDSLVGNVLAIVISVTAVLFFGEILPHSLFLKHRFQIGAKMVPVIMLLMLLWWPLAKPLSFILDKFIGTDNHLNEDYNRHQLRAMVNYQGRPSQLSPRPFSDRMGGAEVAIISSTLEMKNLRVRASPLSPLPPSLLSPPATCTRRSVPLTHSCTNRHRTS